MVCGGNGERQLAVTAAPCLATGRKEGESTYHRLEARACRTAAGLAGSPPWLASLWLVAATDTAAGQSVERQWGFFGCVCPAVPCQEEEELHAGSLQIAWGCCSPCCGWWQLPRLPRTRAGGSWSLDSHTSP
ncbi:uncharacterized protein LOC124905359 isoform X2 [Homo sapiens]|uniref:uncharacterized protein LOC124905359 isoform X2 n=1 Tax=Homo sapiens TaxID=9606 RepID=UPI0005D0240D|nr:uncharacterized protein LOC124905359 isoform X2 [Homo sapiens]